MCRLEETWAILGFFAPRKNELTQVESDEFVKNRTLTPFCILYIFIYMCIEILHTVFCEPLSTRYRTVRSLLFRQMIGRLFFWRYLGPKESRIPAEKKYTPRQRVGSGSQNKCPRD